MNNQLEFAALFQSNTGIVHKICNLYFDNEEDKKDLFQEIATSAWSAYPQFRGESKFSTWLYNISKYRAIDAVRRAKARIKTISTNNAFFEITDEVDNSMSLERKLFYQRCLSRLNEEDRKFVLMWIEGYSYDDMEETLGVNQNNLRVKMNRIKEKLRKT